MILEEADLNEEKVNTVTRKRFLIIIVFSEVIVDAIIMSNFR